MSERWIEVARRVCSPQQFRAIELRDEYGFTLREVAFHMDLALSTVVGYIKRGEQKVVLELRQNGGTDVQAEASPHGRSVAPLGEVSTAGDSPPAAAHSRTDSEGSRRAVA